ncbi:MAG: LLM class F420-dependent oxidoreductase [Microthrixaceae bacterium]|nr:LLM class F420-dependent oxidoreductase [Microthrixaceae bacterium]
MRFGLTIFATDESMDVGELAVESEARGFDSLWIPEHTHIPVSRRTPPPTGDAELAREYKRSLDPLVALAFAAARTTTIRLGTGIVLPAQREPIVTAKAIATLQNLSGGRFELGIGFGWNADEMESHGIEYRSRRAHTREHVLAMQHLWNDEVAEFHGEYVNFEPSWSWPKPATHVPVLLGGGAGPKLFAHIVEYCDGWIPIGGSGLADSLPVLRSLWADAGRDPDALKVVPFGTLPTDEKLEHFASLGVTECVFRIPSASRDDVMPTLESQAAIIKRWS